VSKKSRSRSAPNPGWFPKGRSGNLKGRPTSSRAPKALRVRGVGGKTLTVTDHLGTREITMKEGLERRTYQNALAGKPMATREV